MWQCELNQRVTSLGVSGVVSSHWPYHERWVRLAVIGCHFVTGEKSPRASFESDEKQAFKN